MRYGGNTACLELRVDTLDRLIIIDAGSGIRELGDALLAENTGKPLNADIFITHTHWDHIMGFPFFAPIYVPSTQLRIHGPVTYEEESLKEVLRGQWTYRYFPVRHEELSSQVTYIDLKEGEYDLGQGLRLKTKYLNHPLLCLGYRFEFGGKVLCTAYDTEPFSNLFSSDPNDPAYDPVMAREGQEAAESENRRIEEFIRGADLLIYDTQYTQAEYTRGKEGWGHSPIEYAVASACRNKVKRVALFHHDVQRSDAQLDALERPYVSNPGTRIFFAREGMQVVL
jgi:phosphoribosyl 1,2-cyclic phosphodiesterase